jgi:hypothetical protein
MHRSSRCAVLLSLCGWLLGVEATSLGSLRSARQDLGAPAARQGGSPAELEEEEESMEELLPPDQASPSLVQSPIFSGWKPAPLVSPSWATEEAQVSVPPPVVAIAPRAAPQLPPLQQPIPPVKPKAVALLAKSSHLDRRSSQEARTNSSLMQALPTNWPPEPETPTDECNPPCIDGRGVCNDNVCFCKHPYTGSTCQHNVKNLFRVSYALTAGVAIFCIIFGIVMAKILTILVAGRRSANTLAGYGENASAKHEMWQPPSTNRNN